MLVSVLENLGSKKRYKIEIAVKEGFFDPKEYYEVLVLSGSPIEESELKNIAIKLAEQRKEWLEKKGKKTDFQTVIPQYIGARFFIKKLEK